MGEREKNIETNILKIRILPKKVMHVGLSFQIKSGSVLE